MEPNPQSTQDLSELESLEDQGTVVESGNSASPTTTPPAQPAAPSSGNSTGLPNNTASPGVPPSKRPKFSWLKHFFNKANLYLLLFIAVILIAVVVAAVAYLKTRTPTTTSNTISSQSLDQKALEQIANSDASVGDPKQVLNIQSNAVFAGKVLVREDLDVAGKLNIGNSLSLAGVTVSGNSKFDQVQVSKDLSVSGSTSLQGQLTVQNGLQVSGSGNFSGSLSAPQIATTSLQLNGDLKLTHHIIAGGAIPSRSVGSAVGSGGSASVSGSDTTGTIHVGTGSSTGAGCFVTVSFTHPFSSTPHVIVTPVGSSAASLNYYVNRSTSSFSLCTTNSAGNGKSFAFDYIVLG